MYLKEKWPTVGVLSTKFGFHNTFKSDAEVPKDCPDDEKIKWIQSINYGPNDENYGPNGTHPGVDIDNAEGTQLYAIAPGKVVGIVADSASKAPGFYMIIEHNVKGVNYYSVYYHIQAKKKTNLTDPNSPVTDLHIGSAVNVGDVVAHMGITGTYSFHLHFEVRREGGVIKSPGGYTINTGADTGHFFGYWLSDPSQLRTVWLDISSAFEGYDDWYPKSWRVSR
jgi:murein DD-endopeptidase MepM/ murein hydrolase activator NlpD